LWSGWDYHIQAQDLSRSPLYADGPPVIGGHGDKINMLFGDIHTNAVRLGDVAKTYNYNIAYR